MSKTYTAKRIGYINTDARDCDDCTVQPKLTNAEIRQRRREEQEELRRSRRRWQQIVAAS